MNAGIVPRAETLVDMSAASPGPGAPVSVVFQSETARFGMEHATSGRPGNFAELRLA